MPFVCSICEEESTRICISCTKDTCGNHLCDKCSSCSDCCDCEVSLVPQESYRVVSAREPHPPHPSPDPDPAPEPEPIPNLPPREASA